MWQLFIVTFFDWWEIQFDQVWSSLIHFGRIWSKKIKNETAIFILFKNVTTLYTNIFWYVQPLRSYPIWPSLIMFDPFWTDLIQKKSEIKRPFLSFLKMCQLCILTSFDICNHKKVRRRRQTDADRCRQTQTDGNMHRHWSSNSSSDR